MSEHSRRLLTENKELRRLNSRLARRIIELEGELKRVRSDLNRERKNIRAKADRGGREYRWFHYECWARNNDGFLFPHDFPDRARSEFTACHTCRGSINGGPQC